MDVMRSMAIGDLAREQRRTFRDATAVVDGDVRLSFAELDERTNRLADALLAAGVGEGERVLWLGQNSFRVFELLVACAKVGAMVCAANWRQSVDEFAWVIDDLDPKVVVWEDGPVGATCRAARERVGDKALWLQHDSTGAGSYEDFLASGDGNDPMLPVDPALPVAVIYTAAFDGRPNGSMLTHGNLLTQSANLLSLADITRDTVYLVCGPLFHIGTFQYLVPTFQAGGRLVFTARAEAEELCRVIDAEKVTNGFVLGPTISKILELNADRRYDLSTFRSFIPIPEWLEMVRPDESPLGRMPAGFGQTEVTGFACYGALGGRPGVSTAGRPGPFARVRILDDGGNEVPDGEVGEIAIAGPHVHAGYWNRPELNATRWRDGWWRTNDVGRREPDGVIQFVGPKTRMLKSGVENIYPAEVESCIETHPAVKEAAIIGVPDERWTQSVKAVVVVRDGAGLGAADVIEHCRARIASYKKPRFVEFVDALPRVGLAKDYDALDAQFGGGGYPGGTTRSS